MSSLKRKCLGVLLLGEIWSDLILSLDGEGGEGMSLSLNVSGGVGLLLRFSGVYSSVHGRIVYPVTILGVLTSVVTIVVLQRKNFRTTTNLILQHVAFFDTLVLLSYNIYAFYFYILHDPEPFVGQSIFWPRFAIFNSHLCLTAHSIALWLTCLLAMVSEIQFTREEEKNVFL